MKLYSSTEEILKLGRATPHQIQFLLGSWTWACLLRRNLLSIFSDVYELASAPKPLTPRPLSATERLELEMWMDLFPLIYVDLRRSLSTRVYASDASKSGGGVLYSNLDGRAREQFVRGIEETRVRKGLIKAGKECYRIKVEGRVQWGCQNGRTKAGRVLEARFVARRLLLRRCFFTSAGCLCSISVAEVYIPKSSHENGYCLRATERKSKSRNIP